MTTENVNTKKTFSEKVEDFFKDKRKRLIFILSGIGITAAVAIIAVVVFMTPVSDVITDDQSVAASVGARSNSSTSSGSTSSSSNSSEIANSGSSDNTTNDNNSDSAKPTSGSDGNRDTSGNSGSNGTGNNNGSNSSSGNGSGSGGSGSAPAKTWVPTYEDVWVVDSSAWTETIPEQGYTRGYFTAGGQRFYNEADLIAFLNLPGNEHLNYSTGSEWVVTAPAQTINHPEVGHWENRETGGYWK